MSSGAGAQESLPGKRGKATVVVHLGLLVFIALLAGYNVFTINRRRTELPKEMTDLFLSGYVKSMKEILDGSEIIKDEDKISINVKVQKSKFQLPTHTLGGGEYGMPGELPLSKEVNLRQKLIDLQKAKQSNPYLFSFTALVDSICSSLNEIYSSDDKSNPVIDKEFVYAYTVSFFSGKAKKEVYKAVCDVLIQTATLDDSMDLVGVVLVDPNDRREGQRDPAATSILFDEYCAMSVILGCIATELIGEWIGPEDMARLLGVKYSKIYSSRIFSELKVTAFPLLDQRE